MASATVGFAIVSCQCSTGSWLVMMCGAAVVPVIDNLQEIVALIGSKRREAPIIEDQQIDARERAQQAHMATITARQRKCAEQPRHTLIEHTAIIATGFVAERTGEKTFADSGWADDDQVELAVDPIAGDRAFADSALSRPRAALRLISSTTAF